jgi:hypothetical protein
MAGLRLVPVPELLLTLQLHITDDLLSFLDKLPSRSHNIVSASSTGFFRLQTEEVVLFDSRRSAQHQKL